MPDLPARANLDQLRRQAKDLLRAARRGDETAVRSFAAVAGPMSLATAQLTVARRYGFASWAACGRCSRGAQNWLGSVCSIGVITRPGPAHLVTLRCCATTPRPVPGERCPARVSSPEC